MPTAHCISTKGGIILAVDRNFLLLMQREESDLVGRSYRELTWPEDLARSEEMLSTLIDRAPPTKLRKRYVRPDGSIVEADLLVSMFEDTDRLITTLSFGTRKDTGDESPDRLWQAALHVRHINDIRRHELGADLFTDHLSAIIVEVYLAEAEARVVSIHSLTRAIDMSISSMTRWLAVLRNRGLIEASIDADDAVQFTHAGLSAVERILTAVLHPNAPGACDRGASE